MALSDTARLISSLELQDKFSQTASAGEKALGGLESKSNFVTKGFGLLGQAGGAVGDAFSHLKGRIGQLLTGPLGMLGLGAGLFSVFGLIKGGIDQARDFGKEVGRLASVTGLSVETTSKLAAAFTHFGIETEDALTIAGLAEKNLFKLGGTAKDAAKFHEKYGLELVDASGKLKDFNTILLDSADFFNDKQIPAEQKAAALAAIFGRSWQNLVPILSAGSKGISDAEDEAQKLGLTLTKDNLGALSKLKEATRRWGDALGGLKLQLGLAVIPLLTDLTTGATNFLSTADKFGVTGSQKIVGFFKDVIEFGKKAFGIIQDQVVPLVKKVIDGWNNLPEPLKGLLVKGVSGNFAIKFLLGFDPIAIAGSAATAIAGKLAGAAAGALTGFVGDFFGKVATNKLIPQAVSILPGVTPIPVFVTNPGFGLPTVGPSGGPGANVLGKGLTLAGILKFIGFRVVPALAVGELAGQSNISGRVEIDLLRQALIRNGGDVKAALQQTGTTLGAINDLLAHPDLQTGLSPEVLTALDAIDGKLGDLVTNTTPTTPTGGETGVSDLGSASHHRGTLGVSLAAAVGAVDPAIDRLLRERVLTDTALAPLGTIETDIQKLPPILDKGERTAQSIGNKLDTKLREGFAALNAKDFSPNVKVDVTAITNVSVNPLQRTLTSARIAGSGSIGGFTESAFG